MRTKHWLFLGGLAACGFESVACSSSDRSCTTTRTCEATAGNLIRAEGGAAGHAKGGSAGINTAHGGEDSLAGEGGEGGEGRESADGPGATHDDAGGGGAQSVESGGGGSANGGNGASAGLAGPLGRGGASGGAVGSGGSGPADTVPPTILSITPINGATRLTTDTDRIVITFSEPMNKLSAQAAFVPYFAASPLFSWNSAGNELTIDPKLRYPTSNDPAAASAPFGFDVTTDAKDLAGNSLTAGVSKWQFSLLREITQAIPYWEQYGGNVRASGKHNDSLSVGDLESNEERRGFATYDLSPLPDGIRSFLSASIETSIIALDGHPFESFGNLLLQSVQFQTPDANAYSAMLLLDVGTFLPGNSPHFQGDTVSKDVLPAFAADYANRAARGNLSQYRLLFASAPNQNSASDAVVFANTTTGNILTVKYLFP